MRFPHFFLKYTFVLVAPILVCLSGCGKEISPEQRQADSTLVKAKEAIAQGQHRTGRRLLAAALELDRELQRIPQVAEELSLFGASYAAAAHFDSAMQFYAQAIEQYKSLADRKSARSLTLEIAFLHRLMGDERKAFAIYTETSRLHQVFKDAEGVRQIQWAMIPTCRALEKKEEETQTLTELLNAYTTAGDIVAQAKVNFEIGRSKFLQHKYTDAAEGFLRSLALAEQVRDSLLAINVLLHLARTYSAEGKIPDAFQMYTEGLRRSDITRNARALREEMLVRVGNIYLGKSQPSEAARFYRAALSSAVYLKNKIAEGYLFIQLGHCEVGNRSTRDNAIKNYQTALELFTSLYYPPGSAYALQSLALAAHRSGQLTEASRYFKQAAEQSEVFLKSRDQDDLYLECESVFFSEGSPSDGQMMPTPYDGMINLLLQLGRYDEAFWYVGRRDGREMFEVMSSLDPATKSDTLNGALRSFRHRHGLRIGAERQIARLLTHRAWEYELLDVIRESHARLAKQVDEAADRVVQLNVAFAPMVRITHLSLAEVQRVLPERTALLEHVATRRSTYTFFISGSRSSVQVSAVEREKLLSMAREYTATTRHRQMYTDSGAHQTADMERRIRELTGLLHGSLVRQVEASIPGLVKLYVVPFREHASLPLHALRREAGRSSGRYLTEQCMVSYLPSPFALTLTGTQPVQTKEVAGLGHPGSTSWDVEYELRDIRAFYKEAQLYFSQQATLASLQRVRADIMHIAAEFHFNRNTPGTANLTLSDGKSFYTSTQVPWGQMFSIPGFSALVVADLSEAGNVIHPAQPMIFLMNGSNPVILNGLPAMRKAKKYFSEIFYTMLLGGGTSQMAIRQVHLEMIKNKDYTLPHVWAPFFVWGK